MENRDMVEFKNICKSYNGTPIIQDFNLEIKEGDFLAIVGSSGSGKTTLLKMINGLIIPDSGQILIAGEALDNHNMIKLRRSIGYAIQGNGLFPHMTVAENIGYVPKLEGKSNEEINALVKSMLNLVRLPERVKDSYPHELSGGQQQRVGIARAYANKPKILLMDEPFGALDTITRYHLQKDVKQIHEETGCTTVFITHDIHEAYKLSSHIMVLHKGKIQQYGETEEVWNNPQNSFVKELIEMVK